MNLEKGLSFLSDNGLNLIAIFDCASLPQDVIALLTEAGIDLSTFRRLVMLGNGGRDFWQAFSLQPRQSDAPVDDFSIAVAKHFVEETLAPNGWQLLYPGAMPLPLQRLGELAGWCHPSPLGSGISSEYGLWFAYRIAFVTTADLPVFVTDSGNSPCQTCTTFDCVAACPSYSVSVDAPLKLMDCIDHRLQPDSSCATRCLARIACPYQAEHRYTNEQIHYHYNHSHHSLRRYLARQRGQDGA